MTKAVNRWIYRHRYTIVVTAATLVLLAPAYFIERYWLRASFIGVVCTGFLVASYKIARREGS